MQKDERVIYYFICLITYLCVCYIFFISFFPISPALSGFNSPVNVTSNDPKFDKFIMMVVDAMRPDMVTKMNFTNNLIKNGKAKMFHAHAHPPTVTMPRLKALTSGEMPIFLDIIHNLDSTKFEHDNWIQQMKFKGKKIHFFGDETWLKLFPNVFDKYDGTTAFFVTDTVQVDLNVTRHIDDELNNFDWDVLILHYLGLDHVGHLGGVNHYLMNPKIDEMDKIVEKFYNFLIQKKDEKILFLLCSDHGMTDSGNHGGASKGETESFFVFISKNGKSDGNIKNVNQVDLVPTLSSLFGLPIPKNNVGRLLVDMFEENELLVHLENNANQLLQILKLHNHDLTNLENELKNIKLLKKDKIDKFDKILTKMSNLLIKHSTHFDMIGLIFALIILLVVFISFFVLNSNPNVKINLKFIIIFSIFGFIILNLFSKYESMNH